MKTVRELFSELDEWKAYKPSSTMSSIAKSNHIMRLKQEIKIELMLKNIKIIYC